MHKEEEKVIYEEKDGVVVKNLISDYVGKEGVWALYGRDEEDDAFECLNVGKEEDIGSEILFDVACLHLIAFEKDGDVPYTNQFGVYCDFKYKQGIRPQVYLYPFIADNYHELKFVYVHDKSSKEFEKSYAEEHEALYWRNGSPYDVPHQLNPDRKDFQFIRNNLEKENAYTREELVQMIETEFGFATSRAKRVITESLKLEILVEKDGNFSLK